MKKSNLVLIGIILISLSVIGYELYSGGSIGQNAEYLFKKEIPTAQLDLIDNESTNKNSLGAQLYENLTEDEQEVFDIIYNSLSCRVSSVSIRQDIEPKRIFDIVQMVVAQHPEIFWSKGDCGFSSTKVLTFYYPYTREEIEEKNVLIEKRAKEIFEEINPTGSEYEKSLAIFDYIVKNTSYADEVTENLNDHVEAATIEGVFLNSRAICSGYARAYQYLLSLAGIDAMLISGTSQTFGDGGDHAWIAQVVDNEIYFCDPTWADAYEKSKNNGFVSHAYFLMTSEDIENTHFCDAVYEFIQSTSDRNNYFMKKNLYFEEYNQPAIRDAIKTSVENNEVGIEFKFTTDDAYEKARDILIKNENIYLILMSIDPLSKNIVTNNVSYNYSSEKRIITFFYEYK